MFRLLFIGTLKIWLMLRGSNARFIAMDAGTVRRFKPDLSAIKDEKSSLGFYIKDTSQPMLNVYINPKFTHEINRKSVQQKIGREGNLKVSFGKSAKARITIIRVDIN